MARVPGLLLSAALFLQCAASARPKHAEFSGITNFLRIDSQICTGGQPTLDDLARMKDEGVHAVLNLRRPEEFNAAGESATAQSLGLRYFLIPVDTKHPRNEQVDEFLKILADPQNRPIFIHCHTANRVGAFWMIRRVLVDGWSVDDAEREANKIGLRGKELRRFARDYIRRHSKNPA